MQSIKKNITDDQLIQLNLQFPDLVTLDLSGCENITDKGVIGLTEQYHDLQKLVLQGCNKITDKGLVTLAKNCPKLTYLDLKNFGEITDDTLAVIAGMMPKLKSLTLGDNPHITDIGIKLLLTICPNLTSLNVTECSNITVKGMQLLSASHPELTISMHPSELVVQYIEDKETLMIFGNIEGLEDLRDLFEYFSEGEDDKISTGQYHTHFFTEDWGGSGSELSTQKAIDEGIIIHHLKISLVRNMPNHPDEYLTFELDGEQVFLRANKKGHLKLKCSLDKLLEGDQSSCIIDPNDLYLDACSIKNVCVIKRD